MSRLYRSEWDAEERVDENGRALDPLIAVGVFDTEGDGVPLAKWQEGADGTADEIRAKADAMIAADQATAQAVEADDAAGALRERVWGETAAQTAHRADERRGEAERRRAVRWS